MAKYKAKDSYKSAKDKYFQYGTEKLLIRGGTVEVEDFNSLPKSIKEHLEEVKPKRSRNKKGSKKPKQSSTQPDEAQGPGRPPVDYTKQAKEALDEAKRLANSLGFKKIS